MKSSHQNIAIGQEVSITTPTFLKTKYKVLITTGAFAITLTFILLEYINGGVVSHHLLARQDLPSFSNWWGLITVPIVFWISLSLIEKRSKSKAYLTNGIKEYKVRICRGFLASLGFGLLISVLWEMGFANILQYIILLPFLIAVFKPVYLPEYLLGFVLSMVYTFGGVLPILIGSIILMLCFLIYKFTRLLKRLIQTAT